MNAAALAYRSEVLRSFYTFVIALALILTLAVPRAQAASLTSTQVSAIVNLLSVFGADPATIAEVQAVLGGSPTTVTSSGAATIDQSSLTSTTGTFTATGSATVAQVSIVFISSAYAGSDDFTTVGQYLKDGSPYAAVSNNVPVVGGRWSATVQGLPAGSYGVFLYDARSGQLLASATASVTAQQLSIALTSPSQNASVAIGQSIPIAWTIQGASANSQVVLTLGLLSGTGSVSGNSGGTWQSTAVPTGTSAGSYSWPTGQGYLTVPGLYEISGGIYSCSASGCTNYASSGSALAAFAPVYVTVGSGSVSTGGNTSFSVPGSITLSQGQVAVQTGTNFSIALRNIEEAQTASIGSTAVATAADITLAGGSCTSSVCTNVVLTPQLAVLARNQSVSYAGRTVTLTSLSAYSATFSVAQGSGSTGTGQTNPVVIYSFTATPSSVMPGKPVTFSWSSNVSPSDIAQYAGGCYLSPSSTSGAITGTNLINNSSAYGAASGSISYTPSSSGSYTLLCTSGAKEGSPSAAKTAVVVVGVATTTTAAATIAATPSSGAAPLSVSFAVSGPFSTYSVSFGDGNVGGGTIADGTCSALACSLSHTYAQSGTYVATLSSNGKNLAAATVTVKNGSVAATGTIDQGSLTSLLRTPLITGTAQNTATVALSIKNGSGKIYGSGALPVTAGRWSVLVTPALPAQTAPYAVSLYDAGNNLLASGSLTITSINISTSTIATSTATSTSSVTLPIGGSQTFSGATKLTLALNSTNTKQGSANVTLGGGPNCTFGSACPQYILTSVAETLSLSQPVSFGGFTITLTALTSNSATFSVKGPGAIGIGGSSAAAQPQDALAAAFDAVEGAIALITFPPAFFWGGF